MRKSGRGIGIQMAIVRFERKLHFAGVFGIFSMIVEIMHLQKRSEGKLLVVVAVFHKMLQQYGQAHELMQFRLCKQNRSEKQYSRKTTHGANIVQNSGFILNCPG